MNTLLLIALAPCLIISVRFIYTYVTTDLAPWMLRLAVLFNTCLPTWAVIFIIAEVMT